MIPSPSLSYPPARPRRQPVTAPGRSGGHLRGGVPAPGVARGGEGCRPVADRPLSSAASVPPFYRKDNPLLTDASSEIGPREQCSLNGTYRRIG